MTLTAHDLLMNADVFRKVYPRWPGAEPEPADETDSAATVTGESGVLGRGSTRRAGSKPPGED